MTQFISAAVIDFGASIEWQLTLMCYNLGNSVLKRHCFPSLNPSLLEHDPVCFEVALCTHPAGVTQTGGQRPQPGDEDH